jgi:hypothetical protein
MKRDELDRFYFGEHDLRAFDDWLDRWRERWLAGETIRVELALDGTHARVLFDLEAPAPSSLAAFGVARQLRLDT